MGKRWWQNQWGWRKNRDWSSWNRKRDSYHWDRSLDLDLLGLGSSQSQSSQSEVVPTLSDEVVIEADDMGHDELDDEVCFGQLRGNIVGIQYYRGTVNKKEMVAMVREPHNPYDCNAIKINNVDGIQVGHIKRELARPLAYIVDKGLARLEGIVPHGMSNIYSLPVDITLWGLPEKQGEASLKLKQSGYYLTGGAPIMQAATSSAGATNHVVMYAEPRRQILTASEVQNQLDKLFENIKEGDKTTQINPAQAIQTVMYPHQKQALNWMIKQENNETLPPFWELKNGQYFNTVLNYQRKDKPESVRGGILADDMGLGKTLEMIALIVTNFVDGRPLAVPIEGLLRQRKSSVLQNLIHKAKYNQTQQLKKAEYTGEPVNSGLKSLPELPSLPDDENLSTPDVSDDEPEPTSLPQIGASVMVKKDDPDFSPGLKVKPKARTQKTPEITSSRPKRAAKRPARYYSSEDEEELLNEETPKKKVKSVKKGKVKSTASTKGKTPRSKSVPASVCTNREEDLPATFTQQTVSVEKENITKGDKQDLYTEAEEKKEDLKESGETQETGGIPFVVPNYTKPGTSECGTTSGRTSTDGPRATLIVCPLSVLSNWLDQFENHVSPSVHLNIYLYYGANREKNSDVIAQQDIVLTTYTTLAMDAKKAGRPLKKIKWLRIVLDEGHAIKNPSSQQTKAICELQAVRKWVLTGTPIQNSMKDLWSLVNFLQVSPFTDKQWWRRVIERPLEKGDKAAIVRVQHLMTNIALRRTKTQMVNGKPIVVLPKREVYIEHVKLSQEERTLYEAMQNEGKLIVSKYFKQGTLLHNYGDVLAILLRLRQLCCHPFLVAKAAELVKETLGDIEKTGGVITEELREKLISRLVMVLGAGSDEECAICLDSLSAPVITHCCHVFCRPCIELVIQNERPTPKCPLCRGSIEMDRLLEVPPEELNSEDTDSKNITSETWKSSSKCDALMTALLKLRSEDSTVKSIVVSQFTSLLTLLEIPLRANGFNFVRFDGSMNTKARTEAIEMFSNRSPDSPTIFLMSLKAGGVGINLTAASRVFLIDPAWNPASEDQAFDRCHRLGQTKDVIITKFIVEDTVETRIMELQTKKRQMLQGAFGQKSSTEQKRQARIKDIKCLLDL